MSHGGAGLLLAYACVAVPMFAVLFRAQAPRSTLLVSALLAVPMMMLAGIVVALAGLVLRGWGFTGGALLPELLGAAASVALGLASARVLARGAADDSPYRRGAVVVDAEASARGQRSREGITLAGLPLHAQDETKHFKLIGTTGTGKSTAIHEMLSAALARGDRAVIADPDGGYLNQYYRRDRGDVILNPFDPNSVKWNLADEITNDYDVDQLARSLIPDGGDADRTWNGYARTFFTAVTQQAIAGKMADDGEIYRLLTQAPAEELKVLLAGTAAGPFLEDANARMFGSVRSVTSSAVQALRYISAQRATAFSVRRWVREGAARSSVDAGGALFFPYKAGEIAALRSMISAWMRLAIFEAMDRGEGDQRLWFVVDELDALGEIDGLKDALARLRKFGGRCVLGFQSISQVSGIYGKNTAGTIVENCGNTLILRCSASEQGGTSQFASRLIGQREILHTTRSRTRRPTEWPASTTTSEHRTIEPAVMASEIERLPDLDGFLKFASVPDWVRVRLSPAR
ncbi:MAG: type IV secretion system DNA-binding domain-containing protein [Pseudomonadota bacterium]|nr:type IV secretion system DNA-binding domain-containing protein [Pseudomonadota bacterium]